MQFCSATTKLIRSMEQELMKFMEKTILLVPWIEWSWKKQTMQTLMGPTPFQLRFYANHWIWPSFLFWSLPWHIVPPLLKKDRNLVGKVRGAVPDLQRWLEHQTILIFICLLCFAIILVSTIIRDKKIIFKFSSVTNDLTQCEV